MKPRILASFIDRYLIPWLSDKMKGQLGHSFTGTVIFYAELIGNDAWQERSNHIHYYRNTVTLKKIQKRHWLNQLLSGYPIGIYSIEAFPQEILLKKSILWEVILWDVIL